MNIPWSSTYSSERFRRIAALIRKETRQIARDPSTIVIAVILPLTLLFLFGYGVTFDARRIEIGLVVEDPTPETGSFTASLTSSALFVVRTARDRRSFESDLVAGRIDGIVVLAADFSAQSARGDRAPIQTIVDGSDPNKATLVRNYLQGVWANWLTQEAIARGERATAPISVEPRVWFNPEVSSHHYLVPGSIAIILMLIGALLTALVVAREWERGTMEALLATPVGVFELLAGKLIPYFVLGMLTMTLATATALFLFGVPFRGSFAVLALMTAVFLSTALAQGLLISTVTRNQLVAAQGTLISAFLPSFFLSGFVFEIDGMPLPLRIVSYAVPARYFVSGLQTLFLAGDVWPVIWPNLAGMAFIAAIYIALTALKTKTRLD
jgi:ABC-2 type transport system permease protein